MATCMKLTRGGVINNNYPEVVFFFAESQSATVQSHPLRVHRYASR